MLFPREIFQHILGYCDDRLERRVSCLRKILILELSLLIMNHREVVGSIWSISGFRMSLAYPSTIHHISQCAHNLANSVYPHNCNACCYCYSSYNYYGDLSWYCKGYEVELLSIYSMGDLIRRSYCPCRSSIKSWLWCRFCDKGRSLVYLC